MKPDTLGATKPWGHSQNQINPYLHHSNLVILPLSISCLSLPLIF